MQDRDKIVVVFLDVQLDELQPYIDNNDIQLVAQEPQSITTTMSPEFATLLSLKSEHLSQRMRPSYISNELKDRYRARP